MRLQTRMISFALLAMLVAGTAPTLAADYGELSCIMTIQMQEVQVIST